jgi:tetratricopeptide (TPR) repeat protein
MKLILLSLACLLSVMISFGQDATELQETAKTFIKQGDYGNAILVLTKALQLQPSNVDIGKDLAVSYLIQKDNDKALEVLRPFIDNDIADDQAFQLAGNIYKSKNDAKEAEKVYRKGLKKFPESGALYNEFGEMLWMKNDKTAITEWEKGIEMDPQYSGNYFNAANYYFANNDYLWSAIYAEIFINIDPVTGKTPIAKNLLLEDYKKLFTGEYLRTYKARNDFEKALLDGFKKQSSISNAGITPETMTMIRTRFILDWEANYAAKFPFKLFELHTGFLEAGLFDAYNQWLLGPTQNLAAYQNWTGTHHAEYEEFNNLQKNKLFKQPKGQYYHK